APQVVIHLHEYLRKRIAPSQRQAYSADCHPDLRSDFQQLQPDGLTLCVRHDCVRAASRCLSDPTAAALALTDTRRWKNTAVVGWTALTRSKCGRRTAPTAVL